MELFCCKEISWYLDWFCPCCTNIQPIVSTPFMDQCVSSPLICKATSALPFWKHDWPCPCEAVSLPDYRVTGNTVLCYCCGLRSFRELTYQYRQNIPASELPGEEPSSPLFDLPSTSPPNRALWAWAPCSLQISASAR